MLFGMPDSFMRLKVKESFARDLPESGKYAVGNVFFPPGSDTKNIMTDCKNIVDRLIKERGHQTVGWRSVPVDNSMLGKDPLDSEPITEQLFVVNTGAKAQRAFEQDLMLIRKMAEDEAAAMLGPESGFYINSLTTTHITYKGQLTPEQVSQYYLDLKDPQFVSHMALVHSRFSTNTFPSWERAQPIRMMCHNGEINTLRGNKNWMYSRGGIMESKIYGDDTTHLLPATSDNMSDSGNFDSVLELITKASDRTLPEAVMMMIPEAWQDNDNLSESKKAFYEYNSCVMEPWDGPAMVAFTDARYIGATLDRNGLRPSRYYVTNDDHVVLSSEIGVCPELPDSEVKIKHRLEPGKMFLLDFESQRIVPDDEIKEAISSARPYKEWVDKGMFDLATWSQKAGTKKSPMDFSLTNRKLNMFGFSSEKLEMLMLPMAIGGKEALGSMGNDAALAVLSEHPRQIADYFKQLFAQVTNPPIDPIREEIVMSLVCPVGPEGNLLADASEGHCQRLVIRQPVLTLEEMGTLKNHEHKNINGTSDFKTAVIDITFPVGSGPMGMVHVSNFLKSSSSGTLEAIFADFFICCCRLLNVSVTKQLMPFRAWHRDRRVSRVLFSPISSLALIVFPCHLWLLSVLSTSICSPPSNVLRPQSSLRSVTLRKFMTTLLSLDMVAMVFARTWLTKPFAR
jgi:glutamate synthase domain-containing protein 1